MRGMLSGRQIASIREQVDEQLYAYIRAYAQTREPQRVGFRELCGDWPWAKRSDAYTHLLHRYPAKLLPYIPIYLLASLIAATDDVVLDVFAGTGTVLLESIIHAVNPRRAYGVEINPLARLISQVKTRPLDPDRLREGARDLLDRIRTYSGTPVPPEFPGVDLWCRPKAKRELAVVRECIGSAGLEPAYEDFFWACFSSIIRDMSRADRRVGPPVRLTMKTVRRFGGDQRAVMEKVLRRKQRASAPTLFRQAVLRNTKRMAELWDSGRTGDLQTEVPARIVWDDARSLHFAPYLAKGRLDKSVATRLADNSIGIVITSPPYINAQKYVRTTKLELWWLDMVPPSTDGLSEFARQFVGTERVLYDEYKELKLVANGRADALLRRIYGSSPERAGIVSRYFHDMRSVMAEVHRVLKPGGWLVLVVGDNTVCGNVVENHRILSEMAEQDLGFSLQTILVDEIRSRGLITKRHETAGVITDEWVLMLKKERSASASPTLVLGC
jgi:DNA modification methylase